jgi:hypothetical protein
MRQPLFLIPVVLLLSASDTGVLASGTGHQLTLRSGIATPLDTGDTAAGPGHVWNLLSQGSRDSLGRLRTECPMPVSRPDPAASESMPVRSSRVPPDTVAVLSGPPSGLSRMPVARSSCWNPLDRVGVSSIHRLPQH